jgi:hypothetical protein
MKVIRLVIVMLILLTSTKGHSQFYYTLDSLVTDNEGISNDIKSCITEICPKANISILATNKGMILKQYYRHNNSIKSILTLKYKKVQRNRNGDIVTTQYVNTKDETDVFYSRFYLTDFSEEFELKNENGEIYATYYFSLTKKDSLCLKENYFETVRFIKR